jgi:hypothetical protein
MASERIQRQIESLLDEAESAVKQLHPEIVRDHIKAVLTMLVHTRVRDVQLM